MFAQSNEKLIKNEKEDFNKPVESIMRCENFKSNFARRLSNRYTSKSPISLKADSTMTLHLIEPATEPSPSKSPVTTKKHKNFHASSPSLAELSSKCVEATALTMEIETLRWQLSQTETNRQMHLALLQQIVSFLNRVKEHMASQSAQSAMLGNNTCVKVSKSTELPRSRSVLHVSRNLENSMGPVKKLSSRKMSKSINNVAAVKDLLWNESKLPLARETDDKQKIIEEITRLISLANTVLSTKIPDLSYTANNVTNENTKENSIKIPQTSSDKEEGIVEYGSVDTNQCEANSLSDNSSCDIKNDSVIKANGSINNEYCGSDFGSKLSLVKPDENPVITKSPSMETKSLPERKYFSHVANFIEDESGFSSMTSFQEIGIPIINIIPPTPCKDIGFTITELDLLDPEDKWTPATIELDKHTMQVFWV